MKKIAILSSSPLMLMLAFSLKKKGNDVTIFDQSRNIGGAWTWFEEYLNKYESYVSKYSNAVVPLNKKEDRFIEIMNKRLKKNYNVKVTKTKKDIITNFKISNNYIYDFSKFYKKFLPQLKIKNVTVNKVETKKNKVIINNKFIFNKVYHPSFFGVKKIIIKNKNIDSPFKLIVSEHISILAKKFKLKNFYYSDFFDDFFDRVKIDKQKSFSTLTTRLTFAMKGTPVNKIKKKLNRFVERKNIIKVTKTKFNNYYRKPQQLKNLINALKGSNIIYVNTTQFVRGFYYLRKIL